MSDNDVMTRALATYARTDPDSRAVRGRSGEVTTGGRRYVVLRSSGNSILAVYRIIGRIANERTTYDCAKGAFVTDGNFTVTLKRMKRWPRTIETETP